MDEYRVEKILETLYTLASDNLNDQICHECSLVQSIRDLRDAMSDSNVDKIAHELGLSFQTFDCPCMKEIRDPQR